MKSIWDYICANKKWFIGGALGLLTGILLLTIGFFPTLLLAILIVAGAILFGSEEARSYVRASAIALFHKIIKKN